MHAIKDKVERVECLACGARICDKEPDASGHTREKCNRCKRVWRVNLKTKEFEFISGKPIPRRKGAVI